MFIQLPYWKAYFNHKEATKVFLTPTKHNKMLGVPHGGTLPRLFFT